MNDSPLIYVEYGKQSFDIYREAFLAILITVLYYILCNRGHAIFMTGKCKEIILNKLLSCIHTIRS